jgi:hypothetical protein
MNFESLLMGMVTARDGRWTEMLDEFPSLLRTVTGHETGFFRK